MIVKAKVKTRKLSNVPSEMLMQALEDLELVLADPYYVINMSTWYEPHPKVYDLQTKKYSGMCEVCHAGAVIAKSLGNGPDCKDPNSFDPATKRKLRAINNFRMGDLREAFSILGIAMPKSLPPTFHSLFDDCPSIERVSHSIGNLTHDDDRTLYFNYFQDLIGILQAEGV